MHQKRPLYLIRVEAYTNATAYRLHSWKNKVAIAVSNGTIADHYDDRLATIHELQINRRQTNDISYPKLDLSVGQNKAIKLCKISRQLGNTYFNSNVCLPFTI